MSLLARLTGRLPGQPDHDSETASAARTRIKDLAVRDRAERDGGIQKAVPLCEIVRNLRAAIDGTTSPRPTEIAHKVDKLPSGSRATTTRASLPGATPITRKNDARQA